MNTQENRTGRLTLADEIQLARQRLSAAEINWKCAAEESRAARRRRKEAKQAARRARKHAKETKKEFAEAREHLAELEGKLAIAVEQEAQEHKVKRVQLTAQAGRPPEEFPRAVRTQPTRKKVARNTAPVAALSGVSLKAPLVSFAPAKRKVRRSVKPSHPTSLAVAESEVAAPPVARKTAPQRVARGFRPPPSPAPPSSGANAPSGDVVAVAALSTEPRPRAKPGSGPEGIQPS